MPTSRRSRAVVERALDALVAQLGPAADTGLAHMHGGALAGLVDLHRPDERRPQLVGQQAGCALGELGRVEARVPVGRVQGLTAALRLRVQPASRHDERRDVGDRVPHAVARAATLDVERLVEVHRRRRVDGDERDRRLVRLGQLHRPCCLLRFCDDLVREADRDLQLATELSERRLDLGSVRGGQSKAAPGHAAKRMESGDASDCERRHGGGPR